jgi:hypothetical protein
VVTSVSTARSRAWSILSGLSLSQISIVAVIKLPLHTPELVQFRQLASSSSSSSSSSLINDILIDNNDPRHFIHEIFGRYFGFVLLIKTGTKVTRLLRLTIKLTRMDATRLLIPKGDLAEIEHRISRRLYQSSLL